MAIFTNRAALSYNGNVVLSNIVTGEVTEALSVTKTAVLPTYGAGDTVTYVISIVNTGTTSRSGVNVTDNLGAYTFGEGTLVPLEYIDGSVKYYVDGILQPAPSVTAGPPLVIDGLTVPAGGEVILVYAAALTAYAPLGLGGEVTNSASVGGDGITPPLTAEETVTAAAETDLRITKSLEPTNVSAGEAVTYTLTIENYGSLPVTAAEAAVVSDTLTPPLSPLTVTFNATPWTEGMQYTYNATTGAFSTTPGAVTVPAATYTQDPTSGEWTVVPGVAVITLTGPLSLA